MKFKIINSDQGHHYTHYVEAPDRQTAMDRFKAGHYGSIVDCIEVVDSKSGEPGNEAKKEDGTNVIKIMGEMSEAIAKLHGMDKLVIYRFQAKQIEDTFRLVNNVLESQKKETSLDRDVIQSWQMIKNVLSGKIDEHVSRI